MIRKLWRCRSGGSGRIGAVTYVVPHISLLFGPESDGQPMFHFEVDGKWIDPREAPPWWTVNRADLATALVRLIGWHYPGDRIECTRECWYDWIDANGLPKLALTPRLIPHSIGASATGDPLCTHC
jgi:hypothetical protein